MACAIEPTPVGWKVWRGNVPPELVQIAIDARDHINRYRYGTFTGQTVYNGQTVGIYKSHHTWTNRNGALITGICIPGISLLIPSSSAAGSPGMGALANPNVDALLTPDPTAALFGADDLEQSDWGLIAESGAFAAAVVALFWVMLHLAGKAAR
jgi:hypothetical protein